MLQRLNITLPGPDIPAAWKQEQPVDRLYLPHPAGTVSPTRRRERDVSLIADSTICMRNVAEIPTIRDHVFVGTGAYPRRPARR